MLIFEKSKGKKSKIITDVKDVHSFQICILSTGHRTFDHRVYYKEAHSLARRYSSIVLVAREEKVSSRKENGVQHVFLKNDGGFISRFLSIPKTIYLVYKIKPLVLHFHDYELIFALPFIRIFLGCKVIYDVHEVYPEMAKQSRKVPRILRLLMMKLVDLSEQKLSLLAHYIIASDENIAKRFCNSAVRTTTIYNYPRLSLFSPDECRVADLKSQYRGRTLIIYAGGMGLNKGVFQMIKAMKTIISRRSDIMLLLVGEIDQDIKEQVVKKIRMMKIQEYVDIVGIVPHEDVKNYLYLSKVGLICNLKTKKWQKNIPVKMFEYMACGVPILGSNLPPIASYVNKARCGKLFDSTSSEALAIGVLNILEDKKEWKRMSDAGKWAVQHLWNWNMMEDRLLSVYTELLGS